MANGSTGLDENVASTLCYLVGWVTGLIFILIEKENANVRFHAWQSVVVFGALTLANMVFSIVPFINMMVLPLVSLAALVLWIILMVKAYQGELFEVPVAADLAKRWNQQIKI